MGKNVYILGSLNMDVVISTPYIPRAGETMHGRDSFLNSGGKGANQAVAIAKQGLKPYLIGAVGRDDFAKSLLSQVQKYGVDVSYISEIETNTGVAVVIIENKDNRIILDGGANLKITKKQIKNVLRNVQPGDVFLTQLENNLDAVAFGIKLAKEKGMYVVLNPAPAHELPLEVYQHIDLIILNESETESITGINISDNNFVHIYSYFNNIGISNVIITLGSKGAIYLTKNEFIDFPAMKINVVDTTAAGDTFVGVIVNYLIETNFDFSFSINIANKAASLTCQKQGAQQSIPYREEII